MFCTVNIIRCKLESKGRTIMKTRKWLIRLLAVLSLSLLSLLYAYIKDEDILLEFINASFMIGLFFLVISGSTYVIAGGFFKVWSMGWKRLFRRRNEDPIDRTHWSYDDDEYEDENDEEVQLRRELRKKAKNELFLTLPLVIGVALIAESLILNYLFLK